MKVVGRSLNSSAIAMLAVAGSAWADELNMREGVTQISRTVYDLHMTILIICAVIGVVVFGAMLYSMLAHRKAMGYTPATWHEHTGVEILWTVIPFVILVVMAIPSTQALIEMYDTGGEDMTVEVRGYQWKWEYKYLDEDRNQQFRFFSTLATPPEQIRGKADKGENYLLEVDKPLVIPTGRKVRFLLTSNDVIHAFWVPDFGIKRDAIPGILNDIWTIVDEPGIYRGQCAELCGKDHGFMPIVVDARSPADFEAWHSETLIAFREHEAMVNTVFEPAELMRLGEEVYAKNCASCHLANGDGIPPVFPALRASPIVRGERLMHILKVVNGVPGTAMQAFGLQLNAAEIAAVVHYERQAWGNQAGDITQPADVLDAMASRGRL